MRRRNTKEAGPIATTIMGIILIGLGYGGTFVWAGGQYEKANQAKDWPTTDGVIQTSHVTQRRSSDGDRMYGAEIVYTYKVGDQSFTGSRVNFGGDHSSSSRSSWDSLVNRYPTGSEVTVYYDEQAPGESVLNPEVSSMIMWIWYGGLGMLLLGVLVFASGVWAILKFLVFGGAAVVVLATKD